MGKGLCFTGHRPEKLVKPYDENSSTIAGIKRSLYKCINDAITEGYDTFYTGMARGVDIFAAEIVLELRTRHNVRLVAVVPYANQESAWSGYWQKRYKSIIKRCDSVLILSDEYYAGCLNARNAFMVENSERVIAVYNGSVGGTHTTIKHAKDIGTDIVLIEC